MDFILYILQPIAVASVALVVYIFTYRLLFVKKSKNSAYSIPDWNFPLKKIWAKYCIKQYQTLNKIDFAKHGLKSELPQTLNTEESFDAHLFSGTDIKGNSIIVRIKKKRHHIAEVWLQIRLEDGSVYQLPQHPDTNFHSINKKEWTAAGLKFTILEPFKKIRITFNGLLKKCVNVDSLIESDDEIKHVKFSFIWSSCAKPLHWPNDQSPNLQAEALALEKWRSGEWLKLMLQPNITGYDQYGALQGNIIVSDETSSPITLLLPGLRYRRTGAIRNNLRRNLTITGCCSDGTLFCIGAYSAKHGLTHCKFGSIRTPQAQIYLAEECDIVLPNIGEYSDDIPKIFTVQFKANAINYHCVIHTVPKLTSKLYGGQPQDSKILQIPVEFWLNSEHGQGTAFFWYKHKGFTSSETSPITFLIHPDIKPNLDQHVAFFNDKECQSLSVSGGKGASLALLTTIDSHNYIVPNGFVLTVSALEAHLKCHKELSDVVDKIYLTSIGQLEDNDASQINIDQINSELPKVCKKACNLFSNTPVNENLSKIVCNALGRLRFESNLNDVCEECRFAVRSSAIGEDSEELSAAGQNDTILGCTSDESVLDAVIKCWSSLYSFTSVEYRRQHGLPIKSQMAVVIQLMVPADVAGVMFTCHPTTGNPGQMLITANYGLGETVVSASVDPDTITIDRTWKNELTVSDVTVGKKTHLITMSANSTETRQTEPELASKYCISKSQSIQLAEIGVMLEEKFGGPRDIEWCICNDKIYLLQARPVTSLSVYSDYELTHEFDTPILSDSEVLTFANTGEVLPGAISILTQSTVCYQLDYNLQQMQVDFAGQKNIKINEYFAVTTPITHHRLAINVLTGFLRHVGQKISIADKINSLAVFGHDITNEELHNLAFKRNGQAKKLNVLFNTIKKAWNNTKNANLGTQLSENFRLDSEADQCSTAQELYNLISRNFPVLYDVITIHGNTSTVSVFYEVISMSMLAEGSVDLTIDHLQDVSLLLSSCNNVLSAEIPIAFKEISSLIRRSENIDDFLNIKPSEGEIWLKINCPEAYEKFKDFITRHGHRGPRELDLISDSWGLNLTSFFITLQNTVKISHENMESAKSFNAAQTVRQLVSPKKKSTRFVLKYLVNLCRNSVQKREQTKSALVLIIHKFRLAYRRLSQLLFRNGLLPDTALIYHLTHYEIGKLIDGDYTLIAKANRRRRLYKQWDNLKFNELNYGIPKPIDFSTPSEIKPDGLKIKGTPVYPGNITGRACVIQDLSEISSLQAGDILITHSTDIAWSPYFSMLSGIVTELGGLISHGAVVAREYGLPCIVGAQGATSVFKTGDKVILVASNGQLMHF